MSRCESCGVAAEVALEDGSNWCHSCYTASNRFLTDDLMYALQEGKLIEAEDCWRLLNEEPS